MATVLIASSRPIVSEGLRTSIDRNECVDEIATSAMSLMFLAGAFEPHVCLLDLGGNGDKWDPALDELARLHPDLKFIALLNQEDAAKALSQPKACITGYMSLDAPQGELENAIREVLAGKDYLCPNLQKVARTIGDPTDSGARDTLTPRQLEILKLLAQGKSAKEIAADLDVSKRTVEFHKYRIMRRLGVERSAQMVQYAVEHGLLN